ncbi:intradiol ring-cleavage dioxygenase [Streptomyces sporangiiformans]|uniref:Intradiol ring-cleavage dioxygenase n=1 Tax=Streptomyces sporangiiformans TaxID=2315329 RepID=A0A505D313_9ACTN|nr:intradiol ring-cleavage dioxygenase [Streptomyces sporangiiformans]TPQ16602.1 intradiol ring-cleavage dioxygenase [Streptomyces sporangiiformans]
MTGTHRVKTFTRRRAIAVTSGAAAAGGIAIAGYQAAFADEATTAETSGTSATGTTSGADSGTCVLMSSVTEGPYYLDGALMRKDITEGKSGVPLTLRITVQDTTESCAPVAGAAVEIWHCDAWGYYSGYTTANPGGSAPAESEDGSTANDMTYLRGYQIANANGVVKFETIFPGWYTPRTTHIHVKVHTGGEKEDGTYEGGKVNFTGQLFFDDDIAAEVQSLEPYSKHTGSYTKLDNDMVYDGGGSSSGLLTLTPVHKKDPSKGYKGYITLGIDPDAENTGAGGGGGGGTPPGDAPSGAPSDAPSAPASSTASSTDSSS